MRMFSFFRLLVFGMSYSDARIRATCPWLAKGFCGFNCPFFKRTGNVSAVPIYRETPTAGGALSAT